jgi:two-component system, LytTR family, response regulator LytT
VANQSILSQIPQVLRDWIPETASIAVADKNQYVDYRAGVHDLHIQPGESVRPGSIAYRVFREQARVEQAVDSSVFGIPYYGLGYLIRSESGIESALAIILPPKNHVPGKSRPFIIGQANNVWRPVSLDDVCYFESYQKKTWISTSDSKYTTEHTMQSLEMRLSSDQFVRIHRSFIVNISCISYIERDRKSNLVVILKSPIGTRLPVAESYVHHVREILEF